ncbi:uncharacterized protein LOC131069461 [Cryptomeria japonica]|uniref:uncharacterized protein LOC131069461 n=1 Tax=Cryptomeria japonica TaxID=3369 RepID=UPI0025AC2F0F|nr:uncharacterized protein LOC131069461 [Cryptomeria japonica]
MVISNGEQTKELTLYPPTQPLLKTNDLVWIDSDFKESLPILTIGQTFDTGECSEEDILVNFLQNRYGSDEILEMMVLSRMGDNCPFAVVYVKNKFHYYITGYKVFVHTDHSAIQFLMNKPVVTSRVIRWILLLQEFDITILDKPGHGNLVADFQSMLQQQDVPVLVDDTFPDENLFAISAKILRFADVENYLVTCWFPPHFSPLERRKIVGVSG